MEELKKEAYEKPEVIDFAQWRAYMVNGDSCIGGGDDPSNPGECISGSDDDGPV